MDSLTVSHRSWNMSRIRSENTIPEVRVRSALHRLGFRFRLHRDDLPGRPDIVLPRHRVAIFVHGCFWHRHSGCRFTTMPKSRIPFWKGKFEKNVARDRRVCRKLRRTGWKVVIIWECQTIDSVKLNARLLRVLS